MKHLRQYIRQILIEDLKLDIDPGDIILTGKFKNKRRQAKDIGEDELGQPTINGKSILKFRIEKELPFNKKSAATKQHIENLSTVIPPPPTQQQLASELIDIQHRIDNPINPPNLQEPLDKDFQQLFADLLNNHGIQQNRGNLKDITTLAIPSIKNLKNYFNIKRPQVLANEINFPLNSHQDTTPSAQSPSYPSGHATQAYYLAYTLIDKHPHLQSELLDLANKVSTARIERGVHYPSDIESGIQLAKHLHSHPTSLTTHYNHINNHG